MVYARGGDGGEAVFDIDKIIKNKTNNSLLPSNTIVWTLKLL